MLSPVRSREIFLIIYQPCSLAPHRAWETLSPAEKRQFCAFRRISERGDSAVNCASYDAPQRACSGFKHSPGAEQYRRPDEFSGCGVGR
jgi:hypothetical protein